MSPLIAKSSAAMILTKHDNIIFHEETSKLSDAFQYA